MRVAGAKLLLVTHVPIRTLGTHQLIDDQTAAGIAQWCKYFDCVTYYGIDQTDDGTTPSSTTWVRLPEEIAKRCALKTLPSAYGLQKTIRAYPTVRSLLRSEIARHTHLSFTLGTFRGDWPSVAAVESILAKREYSAWIDRVETQVKRERAKTLSPARRLAATVALPFIGAGLRLLLRRSSVALLQGGDCFAAYASSSRRPFCTYDTHTSIADEIGADDLAYKRTRLLSGAPLKLTYVGRAATMKGTQDWLQTLEGLTEAGIPYEASWIGDGPEHGAMQQRVDRAGLSTKIHLPGFEGDRQAVLRLMRTSDIFLFCHKTLESPRCLIEALVSGCPLVGYSSPYSQGLVEERGGGALVNRDDVPALINRIIDLHSDRESLAELVDAAARSGRLYNEDAVYRFRAELMHLASS